MSKLYTLAAVNKLVDSLIYDHGYEFLEVEPGVLGYGESVLIAPDTDYTGESETQYHFVIREKYLNDWNSAHTIRRTSKLSKKQMSAWIG